MNNADRHCRYRPAAAMLLAVFLLLFHAPSPGAAAPAIETHAKGAALIDVTSGRILYSESGDTPMRIASLTKIMTAIVAIEHGNLTDVVKTGKRAVGKEGSSIYLQLGERMSLSNMLYGLMLRSGNDAATAIAEHVGGSEEGFVHLMNEKARLIGLPHTQFKNPHGLDEEGHYSSANDLAKLTAYALRNKAFAEIVGTRVKKVPNPHEKWDYRWLNKNKMLAMYEGADGVKTGYTKKALRCLVSSATRNGQQLAAVTINDGDDWADHRKLLDWGFDHYPLQLLAEKGQGIDGSPYAVGRRFVYPLESGETGSVRTKLELFDQTSTAYALGERGSLQFHLNGKLIGSVPVYDAGSVRLRLPEMPERDRQSLAQLRAGSGDREQSFGRSLGKAIQSLLQ